MTEMRVQEKVARKGDNLEDFQENLGKDQPAAFNI